ncbi:MazG family protein [Thermomicrobium sp.]
MALPARLTIVGLGPGALDALTLAARAALGEGPVLLRTRQHPIVSFFAESRSWDSCDDLYERATSFSELYAEIARRVLSRARAGPLVYAVPGHPLVGEATVRQLLSDAPLHGIEIAIIPGLSFIDAVLPILRIDPLADQLQIVDALELVSCLEGGPFAAGRLPLSPLRPALIGQVYDRLVASQAKLVLSRIYPEDVQVTVVRNAGNADVAVQGLPLYELDRYPYDAATTIFLPAIDVLDARVTEALQQVVARLRSPTGCPWDREQTHHSLRRYLLEETYEALDAIEEDDDEALREELGDVLLQVIMHAQIAEERGAFVYEDIVSSVIEKLVRRHPHVFGQARAESANAVLARWEEIKAAERGERARTKPLYPRTMPALVRAQQLLARLSRTRPIYYADLRERIVRQLTEGQEKRVLASLVHAVIQASEAGIDAESVLRRWTFELEEELLTENEAHQA